VILTLSDHDRRIMARMGVDRGRVQVVRHGVTLTEVNAVPGSEADGYDACFLGVITRRKGVRDLVRCWRRVVNGKPDATLVVIGAGPAFPRLQQLVSRYQLTGNIVLTGWLDDEKYSVMKRSKLFLFPSHHEAQSLAICEAMACGIPVVAYDLPVYREAYSQGMIRVTLGDVDMMSTAVLRDVRLG
jgi:glycosyltransferase involved in cell wall biosynthesis